MTARAACAHLVSNCFQPGVRSLDACMLSAPVCSTAEPWDEAIACCAADCSISYAALRTSGVDPLSAYLKVLFDTPNVRSNWIRGRPSIAFIVPPCC